MERITSLARFKASCPYLGRTKTATLRSLSTHSSTRYPGISRLTYKATKCPIMGPALVIRSLQLTGARTAGYASVAGPAEVAEIHKKKGVHPVPVAGGSGNVCPHAQAAHDAETAVKGKVNPASNASGSTSTQATAHATHTTTTAQSSTTGVFDYEAFYNAELEKKLKDKSYRYFNNINRLATKFPVAHTSNTSEEVDVWCSNDYLGMGRNPAVLDSMQ